jgi:hypothetical protein
MKCGSAGVCKLAWRGEVVPLSRHVTYLLCRLQITSAWSRRRRTLQAMKWMLPTAGTMLALCLESEHLEQKEKPNNELESISVGFNMTANLSRHNS